MRNTGVTAALRTLRARGASGRWLSSILVRGGRRLKRALPATLAPTPLFEYIAADIVNNCNLRCPFCLVDYDQVKRTQLMDERHFRALLRLAPAVPEGGFWLSCLHEPTLHPRLAEYLSWIPADQRRKFWFTTNLSRPLPDALIDALAQSGIHHINVSLDTFDERLFGVLRKHGRVSVFRNNLERLVERLRTTPGAPAIRYITMAFRSNRDEIPNLVRWMNEKGRAFEVEVRYTFNTANITDDFRREHFLHAEDWAPLRQSLQALGYDNCVLVEPPPGYDQVEPYLPANWFDNYKPSPDAPPPTPTFKAPLKLRARSDGRLHLSGEEHVFCVNVAELEDPVEYFRALCAPNVSTPA